MVPTPGYRPNARASAEQSFGTGKEILYGCEPVLYTRPMVGGG